MQTKTWPKLYKLAGAGKIQQWEVCATCSTPPSYTIMHGQLDGKIQNTSTLVPRGKNIGRANETTSWEQCILEAQALWEKQIERKGYTTYLPTEKPLRPMLAKVFQEHPNHVSYPCYIQGKIDGIRSLAVIDKMGNIKLMSRQGSPINSMPHIVEALKKLKLADVILDGELYLHSTTFQNLTSAIKRDEANKDSQSIEYHVYDMISKDDYELRYAKLQQLIKESKVVKLVETVTAKDEASVWKWHAAFTKNGYEGVMVRNLKGGYDINKRSKNLLKVKKFMDEEFVVVGVEPCKGKMYGMCSFICQTKTGSRFSCMPEGTDEQRRQLYKDWKNGDIAPGDLLTVKFFSWTTSVNPVPRFPVALRVRTD